MYPLVITYNGTPPDIDYLWEFHRERVLCKRTKGQSCVKYSYSFNNQLENVTYMCAKALTVDEGAETSGCYNQYINGYEIQACIFKVVVKNVPDYSASREKNDLGFLTFDLQTDLSHLFNWNVKQLFMYLTAEYKSPNNELNQVVLWDKIILRGENAILDFKNMNTKYYFWDDGNGLRANNNVTLTLSWNIIPNAGLLPNIPAFGSHTFKFPSEYTTSRM
ncbi:Spase 22/23-subunit [Carabus blaptoides fortunei]